MDSFSVFSSWNRSFVTKSSENVLLRCCLLLTSRWCCRLLLLSYVKQLQLSDVVKWNILSHIWVTSKRFLVPNRFSSSKRILLGITQRSILVKVAPYIVLRSNARWGWKLKYAARARMKTSLFFDILERQHEHKKVKMRANFLAFPSVKFRLIWQTWWKICYIGRCLFFRKTYKSSFYSHR